MRICVNNYNIKNKCEKLLVIKIAYKLEICKKSGQNLNALSSVNTLQLLFKTTYTNKSILLVSF